VQDISVEAGGPFDSLLMVAPFESKKNILSIIDAQHQILDCAEKPMRRFSGVRKRSLLMPVSQAAGKMNKKLLVMLKNR